MRRERSVNDILYDALRAWSDATGCDIAAATIQLADGSTLAIPPACLRRSLPVVIEPPASPKPWPPNTGWSHDGGRFSFDSEVFQLGGRAGDILRLLIDRGGACEMEVMRLEIWGAYPCDDSAIRTALSRLRKTLREILSLDADFDPVEASGSVYRLKEI